MKKSNKKGFTLVELIVVSTIMVMIMGAILNFIQPMNHFYTRTLYNSDSNDVGNSLMDKVEDEIRYSTNVVILKDYEGVPKVRDGFLLDSKDGKAASAKFTNVIVIDNYDFRSYEDNVAYRKGATGYICKYTLKNSDTDANLGYDLNSKVILGTADLYSDMKCTFGASLNAEEGSNQCVEISMDLKKPEVGASGGYVFNKTVFTQTRDVKLVNISLLQASADKMKVEYCDPTIEANIYSKYAKTPTPAGYTLDEGTEARFNGDHKYTYIFYTLAYAKKSNQKLTITIYEQGTTHEIGTIKNIPVGGNIPEGEYTRIEGLAKKEEGKTLVTGGYLWTTYDGIFSTVGDYKLSDYIKDRTVDTDMDFEAKYQKEIKPDNPIGTVTFYDSYDDDLVNTGSFDFLVDSAKVYAPGADPTGDGNKITKYPEGRAEPYLELDGWYTGAVPGTGIKFSNDLIFSHNGEWKFYAYYKPPMTLDFYKPDGSTLIGSFEYKKNVSGATILASPRFTTVVGNYFGSGADETLYWDVEGEGQTLDSIGNLSNDHYKIVARIETASPPGGGGEEGGGDGGGDTEESGTPVITLNGGGWGGAKDGKYPQYFEQLYVKNEGDADFNGTVTIEVTFNRDMSGAYIAESDNVASYTISGPTITILYTGSIPMNGQVRVYFVPTLSTEDSNPWGALSEINKVIVSY